MNTRLVIALCASILCVIIITSSGYAGEYIPKSYYTIVHGIASEPVYLRSKRSLINLFQRNKREVYTSVSTGAEAIPGAFKGIPTPEQFFAQAREFINNIPHANDFNFAAHLPGAIPNFGANAGSFAYSGASASGNGQGFGYTGGMPQVTSPGGSNSDSPHFQSRSGESVGNSIRVEGSATGKNGAFSASSASSDGNGKVRYSVQSGEY